jgi:hypothetical protein
VSVVQGHTAGNILSLNNLLVAGLFHTQITAHALIWTQRADTSETWLEEDKMETEGSETLIAEIHSAK